MILLWYYDFIFMFNQYTVNQYTDKLFGVRPPYWLDLIIQLVGLLYWWQM